MIDPENIIVARGCRPARAARAAGFDLVKGQDGVGRPVHRKAVEARTAGPSGIVVTVVPEEGMPATVYLTEEEARGVARELDPGSGAPVTHVTNVFHEAPGHGRPTIIWRVERVVREPSGALVAIPFAYTDWDGPGGARRGIEELRREPATVAVRVWAESSVEFFKPER